MSNLDQQYGIITTPTYTRLGSDVNEINIPICAFTTLVGGTFQTTTIAATTLNVTTINSGSLAATGTVTGTTTVVTGASTGPTVTVTNTVAATTSNVTGTTTVTNLVVNTLNATGTVVGSFVATTKGDVISHNGTSPVRVPVGTDGQVLVVDTATASDLGWAAGGSSASDATPSVQGNVYGRVDTTGHNYSIGQGSLSGITSGTGNVAIGRNAGATITTGTNNICIGSGADVSSSGASGRIVLGSGTTGTVDNELTISPSVTRLNAAGVTTVTATSSILGWSSGVIGRVSPALSAKGDLLTYTGAAFARLAVGADGRALCVDSAQSTGMNWLSDFSSLDTPEYRYAFKSSGQSIATSAMTIVSYDIYSSSGASNTTTTATGVYLIIAAVSWSSNATGNREMQIAIDGSVSLSYFAYNSALSANVTSQIIFIMAQLPAGVSITARVWQNSGSTLTINGRDTNSDGNQRDRSWLGWVYLGNV